MYDVCRRIKIKMLKNNSKSKPIIQEKCRSRSQQNHKHYLWIVVMVITKHIHFCGVQTEYKKRRTHTQADSASQTLKRKGRTMYARNPCVISVLI